MRRPSWLALIALFVAAPSFAATFTVNSTGDGADATNDGVCETSTPGECTLRAAMEQHISTGGTTHRSVGFAIAGGGPHTITIGSALPTVQHFTVDCSTQSGSSLGDLTVVPPVAPVYKIKITPSAGGYPALLSGVPDGDMIVIGCEMYGFADDAAIYADVADDIVRGCYLHDNEQAVNSNDGNTVIGGASAGDGNIITDNSNAGVFIGPNSSGLTVQGNFIGVEADGTTAAPNAIGVAILGGDSATVTDNLISGNTLAIRVVESAGDPATNNTISNNTIGLDAHGGETETLCNWVDNTGVNTTLTGNDYCTACCAFSGGAVTCADALVAVVAQLTEAACDAAVGPGGPLEGQTKLYFNPDANCDPLGSGVGSCAAPGTPTNTPAATPTATPTPRPNQQGLMFAQATCASPPCSSAIVVRRVPSSATDAPQGMTFAVRTTDGTATTAIVCINGVGHLQSEVRLAALSGASCDTTPANCLYAATAWCDEYRADMTACSAGAR